ncbi:MAG: elongation factor 4 [Candidatus Nomurabacteria bacterium]|nr:MAG: elongation factor 4 [Candidatus Nomurabacteria bacterium]HRV76134.1 translation elongation factor 4 [Candidatus Saccharimonadales bacterium]
MEIRNFCIIAHIDHGKSTLADRMLEITGTVQKREMKAQLLDRMDLEREKGITIKLAPVQMQWKDHELNLIDTPGHVDFTYEVSRSLAACEGAILVVDATQGIQAQTLANLYLAMEADLKIVPVLNKIDLPAANPERVSEEVIRLIGCKKEDILLTSAKTGEGVEEVLDAVVHRVPAPKVEVDSKLRALIFDSYYDDYRGVVLYVRVFDGELNASSEIKMMASGANGIALEVGFLNPVFNKKKVLTTGEIGYMVTNLKSTSEARVGDTITLVKSPATEVLPGYKEVTPFVYAGIFPPSNEYYPQLKEALERLSLSDAALKFSPENSKVLGFGFRVGFLGLLHLEIIKERIEREYDLDVIITNPGTDYKVLLTNGEMIEVQSAADLPEAQKIEAIEEPWVRAEALTPKSYLGGVIDLILKIRGIQGNMEFVDENLTIVHFRAPLATLLTDFYDQLKSVTSGYGSLNYELDGYQVEDLVKVDFYVAGEKVDALSLISHKSSAASLGREVVARLKDIIPRQMFKVSLQAAIGGKFIAREDLSAMRKNVTGHLYGGDVSRKKKLLQKQAKGKERMKKFGKVEIPNDTFAVLLKKD